MIIDRMWPGLGLPDSDDPGLGPLGLVDHAVLQPGALVPRHQHCNDEIFTYLRRGAMLHRDDTGCQEALNPGRLMLMGSGRGLSHEESVASNGQPVEVLQVFVRPRTANLLPKVQIRELDAPFSDNRWRILAAPEGTGDDAGSPFGFRSAATFLDARLEPGLELTAPEQPGCDLWLYVFSGDVTCGETVLRAGDSAVWLDEAKLALRASQPAEIIGILFDRSAPFTRAGTRSGALAPLV